MWSYLSRNICNNTLFKNPNININTSYVQIWCIHIYIYIQLRFQNQSFKETSCTTLQPFNQLSLRLFFSHCFFVICVKNPFLWYYKKKFEFRYYLLIKSLHASAKLNLRYRRDISENCGRTLSRSLQEQTFY